MGATNGQCWPVGVAQMVAKLVDQNVWAPGPATALLRLPQVLAVVPVGRSTLWGWVRAGKFPKPVKLGPMTSAWRASDVAEWLAKAGEASA